MNHLRSQHISAVSRSLVRQKSSSFGVSISPLQETRRLEEKGGERGDSVGNSVNRRTVLDRIVGDGWFNVRHENIWRDFSLFFLKHRPSFPFSFRLATPCDMVWRDEGTDMIHYPGTYLCSMYVPA